MKAITLCKHINKAFPKANAVTYDEFTGEEKVDKHRIWFRCKRASVPLMECRCTTTGRNGTLPGSTQSCRSW